MRDELYRSSSENQLTPDPPFAFDNSVAAVFDDMIARSVPTYAGSLDFIAKLWSRWQTPGSTIFDLGCATGAVISELLKVTTVPEVRVIGVDNSQPMLDQAIANTKHLAAEKHASVDLSVELRCESVEDTALQPATAIILNYTLQFLAPAERPLLLSRCFEALLPGGFLVLSEKIRHEDNLVATVLNDVHLDFKRAQGYSELEISRKRAALENVLIPWTLEENISALRKAGFASVNQVLLWCNFGTILARK